MRPLLIYLTALAISSVPVAGKGGNGAALLEQIAAAPLSVPAAGVPAAGVPAAGGPAAGVPAVKALGRPAFTFDKLRAVSAAKGLAASGSPVKGGPTCIVETIACDSTVSGELQVTDCALDDGTFVDFWVFDGTAGDEVTIDLESDDFDTFLFLLDPVPEVVDVDDDGGAGTNSRITFTLDASGEWSIAANNLLPLTGDPGGYTLTLACAAGGGGTAPAAPSDLTATTVSATEIDLFWRDNSEDEDDFEVHLAVGDGGFESIGTVGANSVGASVSGLEPETTYTFRVRARNAAGSSDWSNSATATTEAADSPPADCVPNTVTLCLAADDRFRVELEWRGFSGDSGPASVVPVTSESAGLFWFFDPDNWEMLVKVLDGCAINDRFWVFAAATTNVEYILRVTDTETGAVKEYFNPLGFSALGITDTDAFLCR